jgi:hypothetical protein
VRRRADGDHIDVLALEHAAEVGVLGLVVGPVQPFDIALGSFMTLLPTPSKLLTSSP